MLLVATGMTALRALIRNHRSLAILFIVVTLGMKALVPTGYMIGSSSKTFTIEICSESSGNRTTMQIAIPMDGKSQGGQAEHGKMDGPCAYSALSMAALSGADASLLALAFLFILALGFAPTALAPLERISHLRPPLRGPPTAS